MQFQEFQFNYQIQEKDLDVFGHVNNANYFVIFEMARWDFITKNGFGLDRVMREKRGPVLLESNVRYRKELKNRDRIVVHSQAIEFDGRFMTLKQEMKRDERLCCEAIFKIAFFDTQLRKMLTPDREWLKACGIIES